MIHVIKPGKRFRYVGPGDGHGVRHTVVSVIPDEIVTWGDAFRVDGSGDSWLGPSHAFIAHFVPTTGGRAPKNAA